MSHSNVRYKLVIAHSYHRRAIGVAFSLINDEEVIFNMY